ncbi:nuclear factor 7, brain-like [Anomaloglossus baeobatrachus]|uniref:nuclear factor 7, brain-like n=1 Tax=Anomaloglossus baeobatrachus TaxID=238106 RepID=UPI003F4F95AD
MASTNVRNEMICCICLNLYTDPVTLICGHNFCRECIANVLNADYRCPQCRANFGQRPVLQRNITLNNIADHLRSREGSEILCMYCIETSMVASKRCLLCEVSLCDNHVAVHSTSPEHILIEPTISFSKRTCSRHNKTFLYYCTEDAECLCASCMLAEKHHGHQIHLLYVAYRQQKENLKTIQGHAIREEEIEKRIQYLQALLKCITEKAASIVDKVSLQFKDLRMKQDCVESSVLNEIGKKQEQVSMPVINLINQLDIKKDSLSKKLATIQELEQMLDPLLYLQAHKDDLMGVSDQNLNETEASLYEDLYEVLSEDLSEELIGTVNSDIVTIMSDLQKGYCVQEASGITLDVNTAANDVHISDDLTTATWSNVNQCRLENPQRFAIFGVLGTSGFSKTRLYWNVEVSKEGGWRVGMAYASISRKGKYSLIGNNKKSWGLRSFNKHYSVKHDQKEIPLACRPSCYKVRIHLDYTAGLLSFYELGDSMMRHLYTYNATFTEALYPVIVVWANAWVKVLN